MLIPIIILVIIVAAIVLGFFFKVLKLVLKVVIFAGIAFCIVMVIGGLLVHQDAGDFVEKFPASPKKMFLMEDGQMLAGYRTTDFKDTYYYSESEMDNFSAIIRDGQAEELLGEDYKLIIFNKDAFADVENARLPGIDKPFTAQEIDDLLTQGGASARLADILYLTLNSSIREQISFEDFYEGMQERLGGDEKVKGMIFIVLIDEASDNNTVKFLVDGVRDSSIKVYPESSMFTMYRIMPKSILEMAIG